MLKTRLNAGHFLLAALALACAILAWRALLVAQAPLPAPPPFVPHPVADPAALTGHDPFFPARIASGESLPVTALPFSLHGIRADSATGRGSAIIAAGDGQQMVYSVGDALTDGVTLAAIAGDHVVLERDGTRETLWLDSAGAESVRRYDPNAMDAMAEAIADADGNLVPPSDVPAPAAGPGAVSAATVSASDAALMPAAPAELP
ncbi:type II secretion system protein N [Sandaracinobacteroides sp. A072]|uniref:type II secretion system protein N n=1 Tax=Sandaracinobacteroides sp. A072 TaxID=3461146 RepID=UPI00404226C7